MAEGFVFTNDQSNAISKIKSWWTNQDKQVFRLFGYAGTGKTTVVSHFIRELGIPLYKVAFLAPTNKAKLVLKERLKKDGFSKPYVSTMHSSLYSTKMDKKASAILAQINLEKRKDKPSDIILKQLKAEYDAIPNHWIRVKNIDLPFENDMDENLAIEYSGKIKEDSPLYGKLLIVIDEASMVSYSCSFDVLEWNIPIIAIGDPAQLPPIPEDGLKGGNAFISESLSIEPDSLLTQITRQGSESYIIKLSSVLRNDKTLFSINKIEAGDVSFNKPIPKAFESHINIVATHKTRNRINQGVRESAGFNIDWPVIPCIGEILLCQKTKYRAVEVTKTLKTGEETTVLKRDTVVNNGGLYAVIGYSCEYENHDDILAYAKTHDGKVIMLLKEAFRDYDEDEEVKPIEFEFEPSLFNQKYSGGYSKAGRDSKYYFDFGYAITVNASQGSEFENVSVYVERIYNYGKAPIDYKKMHYTAVTRAKKTLNIIYEGV